MERRSEITPESAEEFRITLESSSRASEVARIMEGPANPTNPRYDNLEMGPIKDIIIRAEKGQPLQMNRNEFNDAVDAAEVYKDARREEEAAKEKKNNAAAALVGLARRIPFFRGIGFPEENTSATIVAIKSKSIPDKNVKEMVRQAGTELHEFGTEQVQLTVNVPVSMTDKRGNSLTSDEIERRLSNYMGRMLRKEDKKLFNTIRKLKIHDWKKLAELIRRGDISHELIEADEDYIVKPIALSQVKERKIRTPKNTRRW